MRQVLPILLGVFGVLIADSAPATTYTVLPDGSGDYPTIQAAIDACATGDIVELAGGIYLGDGNRGLHFDGKAITLRSRDGDPQACTLDCEGYIGAYHRALRFDSGEQAGSRIEGIGFTGCVYNYGGAVSCTYGSSPSFLNCHFVGNSASNQGGAIFCTGGSSPTFEGCLFEDNDAASQGGAVFCGESTSPDFFDCSFVQNRVEESVGTSGGAIYLSTDCDPLLNDCRFAGNEADYGGALACATESRPRLNSSIFEANSAGSAGGAVVCNGALPIFESCSFVGNAAGTHGGGIRSRLQADVTLTRCVLLENDASFSGGAVYSDDSDLQVVSSTLAFNDASSGGGIFWTGRSPTLRNVIIAFSHGGQGLSCLDPQSAPILTCCDFYGNAGGDWGACTADQQGTDGNFAADPRFCGSEPGSIPTVSSQISPVTLRVDSPCLPGNHPDDAECGLIGAMGPGCAAGIVRTAPAPSGADAPLREVATWGGIKARYE